MAAGISTVANVQLSVLQLPEVAREEVPILAEAQLANAHAPAIIAQHDELAAETVQTLEQAGWHSVPESGDGLNRRRRPSYREPVRAPRLQERLETLAAAHPFGVGSRVDVLA